MRRGLMLALLLAAPVPAQGQSPDRNAASCVAAAEQLDARVRAREQPTAQEKEDFETCIGSFNCEELSAAVNAGRVPTEAVNTHVKGMRFTMSYCGNTSAATQKPPEQKKPAAGSAFGEQPKSAFPR